MLILLAADDPLAAQDRDFSAERLILDDNGVDGGVNRVVLQTSSTLATDVIYTFPASGTVGQVLATDGSGILSWVPSGNALLDEPFLTTSTSSTLTSERILTGGLGVTLTDGGANMPMSVAIGQDVAPTASPTFDGMRLTDDLDMDDNTIFDIPEIVAPPNTTIDIRSERSVVLHIDENNTGGGPHRFRIKGRGSVTVVDDIFNVTEIGLPTINSRSEDGGLRIRNTNTTSGTVDVLQLSDGTDTIFTIDRNGDIGIGIGPVTPGARIEAENRSPSRPTIQLRNTHVSGVGLEVADGAMVGGVTIVASGRIPADALVVNATGATIRAPLNGDDGQIIYVVNTTASIVTIDDLASNGGPVPDDETDIPQGQAISIVRVAGDWYPIDRL